MLLLRLHWIVFKLKHPMIGRYPPLGPRWIRGNWTLSMIINSSIFWCTGVSRVLRLSCFHTMSNLLTIGSWELRIVIPSTTFFF